ncbi:1,4-alpha-glucan branching protein GlgB [Granulosicoccus antarcticus]|uniref:1,4-alpha-glucan branching enzyme GlgB n=1 Tax=Granulosicoccus antarcticus IMCC3135 TaxID=1192854 RepID=A0A2Z2NR99_9GAMM|nr:1,4-alpha-glucan branching protein GlgB [Granulosicoccus antarcticus]ASJ72531.1 1,4-alpha-glucan branching enzyme GlgB [Granulosicoccus antarcticus IMCC3135]
MNSILDHAEVNAIVEGRHPEPFAVLGQHPLADASAAALSGSSVIRTFQPHVQSVNVIDEQGKKSALTRVHPDGLFEHVFNTPAGPYRLELANEEQSWEVIDAYSMTSPMGEMDRYLLNEGTHQELYNVLGSNSMQFNGVAGVQFAVWAPNARRVSVVGDFNDWDGRRHVMRAHPGSGVWDIFIPGVGNGALYKFEIIANDGRMLPLKHDPYAPYFEQPPGNASIVFESQFIWSDDEYQEKKKGVDMRERPISIYEVHAGSWRLNMHGESLTYVEMAKTLLPYAIENGFTHIELMPITEHPFDGSWGYQPIGLFAPTSRFGSPDDFRHFVDACHAADIGVIMDWVPAHFPTDAHGLGEFDGTHLYEHADPRQGMHQDWQTLIYNFGRAEVSNYLLSNALYWIREFHLDGLRVDAVASMLYLDYSREQGQWIPNRFGGRENLEAVDFLKSMNILVHAEGGITLAEESTSFPGVSHPTYNNGLGFTFKWNMGWMHDMLEYMSKDSAYRRYHHNSLTFGMIYAFSENFCLPFSHDEVVYGKGSMINKMPGDDWQKFANLRALYGMMWGYPGKKLNFMGGEIAQYTEWQHSGSIQWHLLEEAKHEGIQSLVRDLNHLYAEHPALHESDCDSQGFEWIDCDDHAQSVISFYRYSKDRKRSCVIVCNFTPVIRNDYLIGVNEVGFYQELINTDAECYGGSGQGNHHFLREETPGQPDKQSASGVMASSESAHNRPASLSLTLPPLGVLILEHTGPD